MSAPLSVDGQFINVASLAGAVATVRARAATGHGFTFFTLNLDHLVKLRDHAGFRDAYRAATFVSADGWPVALLAGRGASRRDPPPVRVTTGADLVVPLCATAAADGVPVYLFGATAESLVEAAAVLRMASPNLDIRGWHAPPFGFDPLSPAADADADRIAASGARLVFVALGAPKQELFAARAAMRHPGLGLVCVGAALDFLSGAQVRAPRLVRTARLEWLWRLAHAPKALTGRYARCAALLFSLTTLEPALRRLGLGHGPDDGPDPTGPPCHSLCIIDTMDPRSAETGRVAGWIHRILCHRPADVSVLFVGTDAVGDCALGVVRPLERDGRPFDFLPVARSRGDDAPAGPGLTLRVGLGTLRHRRAIRRALGPGPATADLHRFGLAPLARLLGLPAIQTIHGGDRGEASDRSSGFVRTLGERLALRWATAIVCADPAVARRMAERFPGDLPKVEPLDGAVEPYLPRAHPFACDDGVFRLFAATPDAGVDPTLVVATVLALRARLEGRVALHLVGAGDSDSWPGFAAIRDITWRHDGADADGIARILAPCHAGLAVAFSQDRPGLLLAGLTGGRPFGALRPAGSEALETVEALVDAGTGGFLVERGADTGAAADRLAERFVRLWDAIRQGRVDPEALHARAASHVVAGRLGRLFARHRAAQGTALAATAA
ncbi:WecB/TagA/CpsF family glycosyltransferase [Methylobacterium sp. Leaf112]|uniref:WecB/TagA/CpsF family glycosyltransferase n=1 Tax=Methylobacterium sp. Leaf112 TaxID=1736258 RepID=UPI0006F7B3E5|nr:WecB/TagA/CpsF family glycosyltransferase [Methylobacterium sp. Leaf112]KQP66135.1 hypothetical protein ASF52_03990 [Methylobacterium sp. Leaf112]